MKALPPASEQPPVPGELGKEVTFGLGAVNAPKAPRRAQSETARPTELKPVD